MALIHVQRAAIRTDDPHEISDGFIHEAGYNFLKCALPDRAPDGVAEKYQDRGHDQDHEGWEYDLAERHNQSVHDQKTGGQRHETRQESGPQRDETDCGIEKRERDVPEDFIKCHGWQRCG